MPMPAAWACASYRCAARSRPASICCGLRSLATSCASSRWAPRRWQRHSREPTLTAPTKRPRLRVGSARNWGSPASAIRGIGLDRRHSVAGPAENSSEGVLQASSRKILLARAKHSHPLRMRQDNDIAVMARIHLPFPPRRILYRSPARSKKVPIIHGELTMTIQVGDKLPEAKFRVMTAEGPQVKTTDDIFKGKKVALFAVPGAYTGTCHKMHLPGIFLNAYAIKDKGVSTIAIVSVNDAFVMNAWKRDTDQRDEAAFLADGNADFTKAIGMELDPSANGVGIRSNRCAMPAGDGVLNN